MPALEITIQRAQSSPDGTSPIWPATLELRLPQQLPRRVSDALQIGEGWLDELAAQATPETYGQMLGEALFHNQLRDLLLSTRTAAGDQPLHILLVVEDPDLHGLRWEWLAVPDADGTWDLLAHQQQFPLTRSLPSASGRSFASLSRHDLRALIVLANPPADNPYNVARFDEQAVCDALQTALGDLPCDVLGTINSAVDTPTLANLRTRLTVDRYAILHIVAHGSFSRRSGKTALHLLDENLQLAPVDDVRLERELRRLKQLPHFVFFTACESAERARDLPHTGLAQKLVRDVGIPAVVAMTRSVSMNTANQLADYFYPRLREHGSPALALAEARAALYERMDVLVPALYSRLEDRPLFAEDGTRPPTPGEIDHGLERLRTELARRAPAHQALDREMVDILRGYAEPEVRQGDPQKQAAWQAALEQADQLSRGVLSVGFMELNGDASLPTYDDRCPFPGTRPFTAKEAVFFHGRDDLTERLVALLEQERYVTVLGPAGSGKSSLLQAGVAPRLADARQVVITTPDQSLDEATSSTSAPALLIVDQAERLFTTLNEQQRNEYATALQALPAGISVALVIRESSAGHLNQVPALRLFTEAPQVEVPVLAPGALREIVERQAAEVGLRFEAEVARTAIGDVAGEPGAMPLLQATLGALWEQRYGIWLRMSDYLRLGGAETVAIEVADGALAQLETQRAAARRLLLRLARVGDDPERASARPMRLVDLTVGDMDEKMTRRLVAQMADHCLVTTRRDRQGDTVVAIAHEAMLRHWPIFQQWIRDEGAFLRQWEQLYAAVARWRAADSDPAALLRGRALTDATSLAADYGTYLTSAERDFIDASASAAAEAQARREAARRTRAALLGFLAGAAGYAVTIFLLYGVDPLGYRLFLSLNQALNGGVAGLLLFLLLDPRLLRDLEQIGAADWARAAAIGSAALSSLLLVEHVVTTPGSLAPGGIVAAVLAGLLWGGPVGAGLLWRAVNRRRLWTIIPICLVAALGFWLSRQVAFGGSALLPLATGPLLGQLVGGIWLPLGLLLAGELSARGDGNSEHGLETGSSKLRT